ncbi:DUF1003 domain-containing protein [Tardiphaga sp.]|jgi:uncharacterized membrane protein|uniref:DUF1003 domain-containing protein n=1 Tax=Tardiphaga sp. TaxID=1926292 RepID=UPI0037D9ED75
MSDSADPLSSSLRRNIDALRQVRKREQATANREEGIADAITGFTGSMTFVYLHVALYSVWIGMNLVPGSPHFDPSFVILAMAASVEAIFLSTFVLISQNRALAAANKRDDLDLHINLLAEHELTKLIELVARIAAKLEIDTRSDSEIEDITKDVRPEAVMGALDQASRVDAR